MTSKKGSYSKVSASKSNKKKKSSIQKVKKQSMPNWEKQLRKVARYMFEEDEFNFLTQVWHKNPRLLDAMHFHGVRANDQTVWVTLLEYVDVLKKRNRTSSQAASDKHSLRREVMELERKYPSPEYDTTRNILDLQNHYFTKTSLTMDEVESVTYLY